MNLWAKLRKSQNAYGQGIQWSHEFKNIDSFCYTNLLGQFLYLILSSPKDIFLIRCSVW